MSAPSTPVDLRDDGVLWALNAAVFHPRGFALAIDTTTGALSLIGDGQEVWVFAEETADEAFRKFEALLARRRADVAEGGDQS